MTNFILIRHKVKDFAEWKRAYDTHLPKRLAAGLTEKHLFRGADNPNEIITIFEAQDLTRAKAFTESADTKEIMQKAGVIDRPDVHFLHG